MSIMLKTIEKASLSHLDALTEFYDKVTDHLEATVNYPKWTKGVYPSRESIQRAIEDGVQYICTSDEKAVGAFILNRDPQGNYAAGEWTRNIPEGEYMVIHTLAVSPDCPRQGIGQFMIVYAIELAKVQGCKGIRLDVVPDNIPARRLYEKAGFTFAGEKDLKRDIPEIPLFALYELNF